MKEIGNTNCNNNSSSKFGQAVNVSYAELKGRKSLVFYSLIIMMSICTLIVCYPWISAREEVIQIGHVFDTANIRFFILFVSIFVLIVLLGSFSRFIGLFGYCKKKKYGAILNSYFKSSFYDCVTVYSKGWIVASCCLSKRGVQLDYSINSTLIDKSAKNLAKIIYSFIVLISCGAFCFGNTNLIVLIIGILAFLISVFIFVLIASFDKNKEKVLNYIAVLSGFLYKCKLVKDYENFYNVLVGKVYGMNMFFKQKLFVKLSQTIIHILCYALKPMIVYIFMLMINGGGIGVFAEVLFKINILELIIDIIPIQKGLFVYELLFITLFNGLIFGGYVYWVMVIYRIFDVYIYLILYLATLCVDKIVGIHKKKLSAVKENN